MFSVPWTSTFRFYGRIDERFSARARSLVARVFPPIELLPFGRQSPITAFVAREQMLDRSAATHLVILERGEEAVMPVSAEQAVQKVLNLNRYEFNYHRAPLVVAHEFFNPEMDIAGAAEKEKAILSRLVANVKHRWIVRTRDATQYAPMVLDSIARSSAGDLSRNRAA